MELTTSVDIETLSVSHELYIPGYNTTGDEWAALSALAQLCTGQGWCRRVVSWGLGEWVTAVGPSPLARTWWRMPYVAIRRHGQLVAVAVKQDVLVVRRRRLMRRRDYQELTPASGVGGAVLGRLMPEDWGLPGYVCVPVDSLDCYTIRADDSNIVYSVAHVRRNKRWYSVVEPLARAATLADMYWSSRYRLGKYIKLYRVAL